MHNLNLSSCFEVYFPVKRAHLEGPSHLGSKLCLRGTLQPNPQVYPKVLVAEKKPKKQKKQPCQTINISAGAEKVSQENGIHPAPL